MIENADSYVALIRLIHSPGSITLGPGEPDVLRGGDPNRPERAEEERTARRALAFLETWVYWGREDTSYTYSSVVNALSNPTAWPASANDRFGRRVLHQIAGIFGLTDPGESEPPARLPTTEDKLKLAAIYDRFAAMFHTMWGGRVVMTIGSGREAWGPELAPRVQVQQSFFQKSSVDQIRHLVMLMATSMTSISPALRIKYVEAADLIRKIRGVGP